jgi:hypothetical protein
MHPESEAVVKVLRHSSLNRMGDVGDKNWDCNARQDKTHEALGFGWSKGTGKR